MSPARPDVIRDAFLTAGMITVLGAVLLSRVAPGSELSSALAMLWGLLFVAYAAEALPTEITAEVERDPCPWYEHEGVCRGL